MLTTDRVRIRPAVPADAPVLHELWSDPEMHLIAEAEPFVPRSVDAIQAKLEKEVTDPPDGSKAVSFVAETVADGTLIGACSVWGIDGFNRVGHLGLSLLPASRGHGYGKEITALLCRYGFRMRNLRRLEIETLATNAAMGRTAEACGFVHEGTQRERDYDGDGYADLTLYGLLRSDWKR